MVSAARYPLPDLLRCRGKDSYGKRCGATGYNKCPRCGKLFCDAHFDSEGWCFACVPTIAERLERSGSRREYDEWLEEPVGGK